MKSAILSEAITAIVEIKNFINQHPNATFIIGKTNDCLRRKEEYYKKGYNYFTPIVKLSSLEEINELEKFLITFSKVIYQDKIENQYEGGGGNITESPNYYIYIASK